MIPPEIRYHPKITEWLERDLPADVRAEIDKAVEQTMKDLFGATE